MKQFLFFLLSAALISCASGTGENQGTGTTGMNDSAAEKAIRDTANYTSIQWLDSAYQDLGKVAKGGTIEIAWRFRNTGSTPLVIKDVRPGCGCTVADRPDAPVAPGKDGVIKAKYDTKSQHIGVNEKNVTVVANTKGTSSHLLTFKIELTD